MPSAHGDVVGSPAMRGARVCLASGARCRSERLADFPTAPVFVDIPALSK